MCSFLESLSFFIFSLFVFLRFRRRSLVVGRSAAVVALVYKGIFANIALVGVRVSIARWIDRSTERHGILFECIDYALRIRNVYAQDMEKWLSSMNRTNDLWSFQFTMSTRFAHAVMYTRITRSTSCTSFRRQRSRGAPRAISDGTCIEKWLRRLSYVRIYARAAGRFYALYAFDGRHFFVHILFLRMCRC